MLPYGSVQRPSGLPAFKPPKNMAVDGGDFIYGGPKPAGGGSAAGVPGMQGFGNDMFYPAGRGSSLTGAAPQANNRLVIDGPGFINQGRPPATPAGTVLPSFGTGGPMAGGAMAGMPAATPWTPYMQNPAGPSPTAKPAPARGPLLPTNTAPNYQQGNGISLEPGQWHNPGYLSANGTMWNGSEPGAWNNPGYQQQPPGNGYSGSGLAQGGMGMGGALGQAWQEFQDATNAANKANRERQNNITGGYEGMKNYINEQFQGLGNQQRKDINTTFDKERGNLNQGMISRGLTNTTANLNMLGGNERRRGEGLARLDDDLTRELVGNTLPVWGKELDFLNSITEKGPDAGLVAQLLKGAAAGPGYGGGIGLDMSGFGDQGYGMPGMMGAWGSPLGMMGYGGGSHLAHGSHGTGGKMSLRTGYTGNYGSPMVFGPDGSSSGVPWMSNMAVPMDGGGMSSYAGPMDDSPGYGTSYLSYPGPDEPGKTDTRWSPGGTGDNNGSYPGGIWNSLQNALQNAWQGAAYGPPRFSAAKPITDRRPYG